MSSKASRIPGAKDRLRKQQIDIRNLQANNRNRNTPRPVATTASAPWLALLYDRPLFRTNAFLLEG